jgi:MFS family permease
MDDQIEKLISHAGGAGRYQVIILIIGFFVWSSLSLHNTSIPLLEKVHTVKHLDSDGKIVEENLNYDLCNEGNYNITETFGFSWVIEMEIECSQSSVGLISSFVFFGLTLGSLLFSVMNKLLTPRVNIIMSIFIYVFFLFLTTLVNSFYFRLFCLLCLGMANGLATMNTMILVGESVSSERRSLFQGIINAGYSTCQIIYTPLYVIFGKWRFIFWLQNIIAITCGIMYFLVLENSARMYFSKNKTEEAIEVLRRIAAFNGKIEEFEEKTNEKEFDALLRNEQEGVEKDLTVEMKPKYGYSALLKYPSVRYKFLIFTFMFMSTSFLTNAVVINTKSMIGNMYVNIVSLFCVEVIAGISCGFIINIPSLGRKKSLIGFYLGITIGFVLYLLFENLKLGSIPVLMSMVVIRFCITGVFTTFYIYFMENYPTPLRALGFGLNSTFGNLAGIVSPFIIEFINAYILYVVFAILCGVDIFLIFFLKETVGKPMIETIEELDGTIEKEKLVPERDSDANDIEKANTKEKVGEKKEPLLNDKIKNNTEDKEETGEE